MISVFWLEITSGSLQNLSLTHGVDAPPMTLSQLELQIAFAWNFPMLSKFGCRFQPNLVMYTLLPLSIVSIYFNDCILKLSQISPC